MIFIAKADTSEYKIEVQETALNWLVRITNKQSLHTESYTIPKKNFQYLGEFISFIFNHRSYLMDILNYQDDYTVFTRGSFKTIKLLTEEKLFLRQITGSLSSDVSEKVQAGMPGKVIEIAVKEGDPIKKGELLLIMEAMKMENEIWSPGAGVIKKIYVKKGENIQAGASLVALKLNVSS